MVTTKYHLQGPPWGSGRFLLRTVSTENLVSPEYKQTVQRWLGWVHGHITKTQELTTQAQTVQTGQFRHQQLQRQVEHIQCFYTPSLVLLKRKGTPVISYFQKNLGHCLIILKTGKQKNQAFTDIYHVNSTSGKPNSWAGSFPFI